MGYSDVTNHQQFENTVSGASITRPSGGGFAVAAGRVVFVWCATDNVGDGEDTNEHTGCTDTAGNTYEKIKEAASGGTTPAADAGITVSVWRSVLSNAIVAATDSITVALSEAQTQKRIGCFSAALDGTLQVDDIAFEAESGSAPSVTSGTISSAERLWLAIIGAEGDIDNNFVNDSDYTNLHDGASTGASGRAAYRIATITDDTYAVTWTSGRDYVVYLIALSDPGGGAFTLTADSDSFAITGTAATLAYGGGDTFGPIDDFEEDNLTANFPGEYEDADAPVSLVAGRFRVTLPASTSGQNVSGLRTAAGDFTGKSVTIDLATIHTNNSFCTMYFRVQNAAGDNAVLFRTLGHSLFVRQTVNGSNLNLVNLGTISLPTYRFLRIREDSGTTFWESSADGNTWVERHSAANPIALTNVLVDLGAGTQGSVPSPGIVEFEGFNALQTNFLLDAGSGSFAITGTANSWENVVLGSIGTYTITGSDVGLTYSQGDDPVLAADSGALTVSGQAAVTVAARRLLAEEGSVVTSAPPANLDGPGRPPGSRHKQRKQNRVGSFVAIGRI